MCVLVRGRAQDFHPCIHITDSDFASITHDGKLCDAEGHLGPREFEDVMRRQARARAYGRARECVLRAGGHLQDVMRRQARARWWWCVCVGGGVDRG